MTMATPDPRLLELTAVLTQVGLDWLALEILEEIRQGHPPEEQAEDLDNARRAVRLGVGRERAKDAPPSLPPIAEELRGQAQLEWARVYVVERLTDATAMANASLEQLNAIANPKDVSQIPRSFERGQFPIALQMGEEGPVVEEIEVDRVRESLSLLNSALDNWSRNPQH